MSGRSWHSCLLRSLYCHSVSVWGILNRQSRAEWQNTFDWLHILPVRVTISQYKSYSANGSHILPICHILPARVTISKYKSCSANGSHILPVEMIFCQYKSCSANKSYSASTSDILPIGVTFGNHVLSK